PPEPSAGRYSRPTSRVGNFDEHHWGIFLSPVTARDLYVVLLLVLGNICALVEHCQTHLLPINLDVGAARR
ncbi:hypothetical protein, partial [Williamsia muralis]|uniref:hypothetical protein n=1 Tax=Williamsia marianensis TaxID=85044 RepID=UPI000DE61E1C